MCFWVDQVLAAHFFPQNLIYFAFFSPIFSFYSLVLILEFAQSWKLKDRYVKSIRLLSLCNSFAPRSRLDTLGHDLLLILASSDQIPFFTFIETNIVLHIFG